MFATFTTEIPLTEEFPWGKELIYRNGSYCGYITSAGYGYSVGKHVCMGYVSDSGRPISLQFLKDGSYEIISQGCHNYSKKNFFHHHSPWTEVSRLSCISQSNSILLTHKYTHS